MQIIRRAALAVLLGAALTGPIVTASAADRTIFSGCVAERAEKEDDDH